MKKKPWPSVSQDLLPSQLQHHKRQKEDDIVRDDYKMLENCWKWVKSPNLRHPTTENGQKEGVSQWQNDAPVDVW